MGVLFRAWVIVID